MNFAVLVADFPIYNHHALAVCCIAQAQGKTLLAQCRNGLGKLWHAATHVVIH